MAMGERVTCSNVRQDCALGGENCPSWGETKIKDVDLTAFLLLMMLEHLMIS